MSKPRLNEHQCNIKLTSKEYEKIQEVNDKFFDGSLTHTQLGRFLFDVACEYLANAKVEQRAVVVVNGMPVTEIK